MERPSPSQSLPPVPSKRERQARFRARMANVNASPEQVVQAASLFQGVRREDMRVLRWPEL